MLYFNLHKLFKIRGITRPFKYLTDNGFSRSTAYNIIASRSPAIRLTTLDRLCTLLSCTPDDIIEWIPAKDSQVPDSHPLHKLKPAETFGIADITKDVPISQMPELLKAIQEAKAKLTSE